MFGFAPVATLPVATLPVNSTTAIGPGVCFASIDFAPTLDAAIEIDPTLVGEELEAAPTLTAVVEIAGICGSC